MVWGGVGVAMIAACALGQPCDPEWNVEIGNPGLSSQVNDFMLRDLGQGDRMLVGGFFLEPHSAMAAWDGRGWSTVGSPVLGDVNDFVRYDDGNGEKLYAIGTFWVGGNDLWHVARLDGNQWTFLDNGDNLNSVNHAIVWDDGTGPGLYVTGDFETLDAVTTHNDIARWDGTQWLPLGDGLNFPGTQIGLTLEVYDDGNGEQLYLGGDFDRVDGESIDFLAAWDGQQWSQPWFGTGPSETVDDLCVFDDGNGPALYAVGFFTSASGLIVNHVAKLQNGLWSDLDGGTDGGGGLVACGVFDDGNGPNLYVSGSINVASGKPMKDIARWDGTEWYNPDGGLTTGVAAFALLGLPPDSPFGGTMFVGGNFTGVGGQTSNFIAEYKGCFCTADWNNDDTVNTQDFIAFLNDWAAQTPRADINNDGSINTLDFIEFLNRWAEGC